MMDNKKIVFTLLFITAVSMVSGSFFEVYMSGLGKEQLMETLSLHFSSNNSDGGFELFTASFFKVFKIWVYMFLCPIIPVLAIFCPFICIFRGFSVGFSSTMLIEAFGIKGTLYILSTIAPHNIIQLPLFCILSSCSLKMSLKTTKFYLQKNSRIRNKNVLQNDARHYLTMYLLSLLILLISCLIEAFLKQVLL